MCVSGRGGGAQSLTLLKCKECGEYGDKDRWKGTQVPSVRESDSEGESERDMEMCTEVEKYIGNRKGWKGVREWEGEGKEQA